MRILVDYRPALRSRTGVGEYIHQVVRAYHAAHPHDEVRIFSSSWRDRLPAGVTTDLQVAAVDRRLPVRVLNFAWHRLEWPPVEWLAGPHDVVHAAHPLLIPSRAAAAVVTIHDLFFLSTPERTAAEIRRDYVPLAASHARRAHAVITSSAYGRRSIVERLGVDEARVYVCPPAAPTWQRLGRSPNTPRDGAILFVGTLEPRKNVGRLLDAYTLLLGQVSAAPPLILAGRATADAAPWLARLAEPPLRGRVRHLGYVTADEREALFEQARVLALPSLDEGFGLTALEAMSAGVPVVASDRGSLPEVTGGAATLVDPDDAAALAEALARVVTDDAHAGSLAAAGLERARAFTWPRTVETLARAYREAVARRHA